MTVRRFVGATARDCLRRAKETLGADAVVVSNRAVEGGVVDGFEGLDCLTAAGEGLLERDWWDRIEQALEFFHVTRIPQIGNRKQLQEVREVNRRDGRLRRQNLRTVSANRKGERNQLDGSGRVPSRSTRWNSLFRPYRNWFVPPAP